MKDEKAAILACLQKGGSLLYPTDTIWGLGCDAHNVAAVEQLYQLKQRPRRKVPDSPRLRYRDAEAIRFSRSPQGR